MSSIRDFERDIWLTVADYVDQAGTLDEEASKDWNGADWHRFDTACQNVARRARRFGGVVETQPDPATS